MAGRGAGVMEHSGGADLLALAAPFRRRMIEWQMRWRMRRGLDHAALYGGLAPLTLSAAFGDSRSSTEIMDLARRCLLSRALIIADHQELHRHARCHAVHNLEPLAALRRRGIGAVVCSLHLGPYFYVPLELGANGFDQVVFAADRVLDRLSVPWEKIIRGLPGKVETLPALGTGSLIRALRSIKAGWSTVIYMDGQTGVGGPGAGRHHTVEVDLVSLKVRLRTGPAFLAQRAGVPMVMAAARRDARGRREIEFSDPIPPPAGDSSEARTERVRELATWFDARIRRDPDQWNGWFFPLLTWTRTGAAPTATRAEVEATRTRIESLISGAEGRRALLRADPAKVTRLEFGGQHALIHGPTRRVLEATPLAGALLGAALRGVPMRRLPRLFPVERGELSLEVTRMVLADLATIEGG